MSSTKVTVTSTVKTVVKITKDKQKTIGKPKTMSGEIDKRYKKPQVLNKDGTRDMRTTLKV